MRKVINIIKKALGVLQRYFIKIPQAKRTARRVFSDGTKTYLVIGEHVGDLIICMGFCASFKKEHNIKQLVVCTTAKMREIVSDYLGPEDDVLILEKSTLRRLFFLLNGSYTATWVSEKGNIWLIDPVRYRTSLFGFDQYLSYFPNITFRHFIEYGCLHLSETAKFQPIPLSRYTSHRIKKPRSIIISSFCQSKEWLQKFPSEFFSELSHALQSYDVDLYTNIGPTDPIDTEIPGTKPLRLTFEELGNWISPEDIVIGLRSGLMDFLAYFDCHIICLYAPSAWFSFFYSLDMLPETRCSYEEYMIHGSDETELQKVLDSVNRILETE